MSQTLSSLSSFKDFGMGLVLCFRLIIGIFHLIGHYVPLLVSQAPNKPTGSNHIRKYKRILVIIEDLSRNVDDRRTRLRHDPRLMVSPLPSMASLLPPLYVFSVGIHSFLFSDSRQFVFFVSIGFFTFSRRRQFFGFF